MLVDQGLSPYCTHAQDIEVEINTTLLAKNEKLGEWLSNMWKEKGKWHRKKESSKKKKPRYRAYNDSWHCHWPIYIWLWKEAGRTGQTKRQTMTDPMIRVLPNNGTFSQIEHSETVVMFVICSTVDTKIAIHCCCENCFMANKLPWYFRCVVQICKNKTITKNSSEIFSSSCSSLETVLFTNSFINLYSVKISPKSHETN